MCVRVFCVERYAGPLVQYTGFFPGAKRPGRGVDHAPPSSAEVEGRVELYIYSPSGRSWPVLRWTLPLPYAKVFKVVLSFMFPHQHSLCISFLFDTFHIPWKYPPTPFSYSTAVWWGVQIVNTSILSVFTKFLSFPGARGGVVVKALRYKPAGRGFDSRWCHWNFSVT